MSETMKAELKEAKENAQAFWECLQMIYEDLEGFGMDMKGCPPMMYNDAVRALVVRVRLQAREAAARICDQSAAKIKGKGAQLVQRYHAQRLAATIRDNDSFLVALKECPLSPPAPTIAPWDAASVSQAGTADPTPKG